MQLGISPITPFKNNSPSPAYTSRAVQNPSFAGKFRFFRQISPSADSFEKRIEIKTFQNFIDSINTKIQRQLNAFTPEKLDIAIKNVMQEVPDISEYNVLTVMQRLTQWANYRCLPQIGQKLSRNKINLISNNTPVNRCFNYFHGQKKLFELPIKNDAPVRACITTEKELNLILGTPHKPDTVFINLEGFDHGVNIFSDDNKLEESTITVLRRIKEFRKEHPDKDFRQSLFAVLNGKIRNAMANYGFNMKTFHIKAPPTREIILAQMAPYSPKSPESIRTTIETLGRTYAKNEENYSKLTVNIADYFDSRLNIYTKQSIIENLQKIKTKIDTFIDKKNIPAKNIFYIIPDEMGHNKSFELITHMFVRQHDIPYEKIRRISDILELNSYPQNSAFVILDDFSGSGDTLSTACNYNLGGFRLKRNSHVLFCPLTAYQDAVEYIKATIEICGRNNFDKILTIDENLQKKIMTVRDKNLDTYFFYDKHGRNAFGFEGYKGYNNYFSGCTVFPYMAPDNNSDLASFITRFFLPSDNAIKGKHIDFDNIIKKINID